MDLDGFQQERAILNTFLALTGSCLSAFSVSLMLTSERKFDMVHIQNSTLAGGVAVGAVVNLMIQPSGALIVGMIAGALSVFGFEILTVI